MAVPNTLEVRLEIMKAIHEPAGQNSFKNFNPNQPRIPRGLSDGGQWTIAGGEALNQEPTVRIAARRISPAREAECEEQYSRDIFQCRMVGLPECYAQAALRYSNCLQGLQLPPLNY
jgi:hypothetical protein